MRDDVRPGAAQSSHAALLHAGTEEFVAGVLAFAQGGEDRGEPLLVAVRGSRSRLLREQLDSRRGQVTWADMDSVGANPARVIPCISDFAGAHPGRVRCVQEPAWAGRTAAGRREVIRHEALMNIAFAGAGVSILCPYDTTELDAAVVGCAGHAHPVLVRDGREQASADYERRVPAGCDRPLRDPPGDAAALAYRADMRAVRDFAGRQARRAGLAPHRVLDLVLAVGELAANTLRHTRAGGRLTIWPDGGELLCQVNDTGHIADPLAGRRHRSAGAAGGQGMWVVHQLSDLAELRTGPGGTAIRLHFRIAS